MKVNEVKKLMAFLFFILDGGITATRLVVTSFRNSLAQVIM